MKYKFIIIISILLSCLILNNIIAQTYPLNNYYSFIFGDIHKGKSYGNLFLMDGTKGQVIAYNLNKSQNYIIAYYSKKNIVKGINQYSSSSSPKIICVTNFTTDSQGLVAKTFDFNYELLVNNDKSDLFIIVKNNDIYCKSNRLRAKAQNISVGEFI